MAVRGGGDQGEGPGSSHWEGRMIGHGFQLGMNLMHSRDWNVC